MEEQYDYEREAVKQCVLGKLRRHFGRTPKEATPLQLYKAVSMAVRDEIMDYWQSAMRRAEENKSKVLYYLSLEFLMGKFLAGNLIALEKYNLYKSALADIGISLEQIEEVEQDAGLGNGGLGRLAACFMDSLASMGLPAMGCGIRYDYGLFRQKIVDGQQIEMPDNWLENGCSWEIARPEEQFEVLFYGQVREYTDETGWLCHSIENANKVIAMPYDIPIMGFRSGTANTLRIWSARSPQYFDMNYFGQGDYIRASAEKELAETISRVLYPNDSHNAGKSLRLQQQYFFTSATLQYMLSRHKKLGLSVRDLPDYAAVQINDTHPAIAIAELMRLLVDQERLEWDEAFDICSRVFSYTNHTIMSEALEKWPCYLMENMLPRIYMIICEINRRFCQGKTEQQCQNMAPIAFSQVRMANLCLAVCHKVNGVSLLHTEILKNNLFRDFNQLYPDKIIPVTNGITPRRWLLQSNPELSQLISGTLGTSEWVNDMPRIAQLEQQITSDGFLDELERIKKNNKLRLAEYIKRTEGITVDPDSIFDIQVKRLHEYKRQLLNVMHILHLYFDITQNGVQHKKHTFIFGAKASPGYVRAKQIISLICSVADLVSSDERTRDVLKVVFVENYGVSSAQVIIPASDISQQISLAGKEASGTGNMKFMMNGALTVGTMDGANVEMHRLLGEDNIFIFGMNAQEVSGVYAAGYNPQEYYNGDIRLRRVVDALADGTLKGPVASLKAYLLNGDGGYADPYLCLKDFDSYACAMEQAEALYGSREWTKKSLINIARSWYFSSDRSIGEYNEKIWNLKQL